MSKSKAKKAIDDALMADFHSIQDGARNLLSHPGEKYLHALTSPRFAKACGIPTLIGGMPGRAMYFKTKSTATVTTSSTQDFGFATMGRPSTTGPYSDRNLGQVSGSTSTATTVTGINATGITAASWGQAPFTASGAAAGDIGYRLVGASMTIWNKTARLDRGGECVILEEPNHQSCAGLTFAQLSSYENARVLGADFPDEEPITLNYHPRGFGSEFDFTYSTAANTGTNDVLPILVFACVANASKPQTFKVQYDAIWEVRGKKVRGNSRTLSDSRAMDLVLNAVSSKTLSGYVVKPHEAHRGYLASAWHWAKKLGANAIKAAKDNVELRKHAPLVSAAMEVAGMAL